MARASSGRGRDAPAERNACGRGVHRERRKHAHRPPARTRHARDTTGDQSRLAQPPRHQPPLADRVRARALRRSGNGGGPRRDGRARRGTGRAPPRHRDCRSVAGSVGAGSGPFRTARSRPPGRAPRRATSRAPEAGRRSRRSGPNPSRQRWPRSHAAQAMLGAQMPDGEGVAARRAFEMAQAEGDQAVVPLDRAAGPPAVALTPSGPSPGRQARGGERQQY